ncbi:hypothetical protein [Streptomyces sp. XY66]|uniref:hypothetical protein n=1 Tax=Streptomyces sp. XY66 TaxID=1415563 RepID=UPI0006AEC0B2|nr:hypothetical protein [Streptomyces sp. XY66]
MLEAQQWLESWTEISGVEGIVLKAMNQPCRLGHRGWYKLRKRNTTGVIIGVITGILIRPQLLLGGPVAVAQHRSIGRTAALSAELACLAGAT